MTLPPTWKRSSTPINLNTNFHFRVTFLIKSLSSNQSYFSGFSYHNILHIMTRNNPSSRTVFYDNLNSIVKTLYFRYDLLSLATFKSISLKNTSFFKDYVFRYLTSNGILTIGDFLHVCEGGFGLFQATLKCWAQRIE